MKGILSASEKTLANGSVSHAQEVLRWVAEVEGRSEPKLSPWAIGV